MKKKIAALIAAILVVTILTVPAFAATGGGNVSGVIEQTWNSANQQIKEVVNKVVFPALSLILVVSFFVKVASAYFDCASVKAI